ncbi:hypothetical protein EHS13_22680 [Paenibacillus psychroresistens]|uniref:Uncharacterized protein n=2 Tax=Paenibacillus psychroresistens TaxID=1778678 RepID=A0A6B8RWF0_9BACL|nr:hypothetical protein EHS13_22680 [Paenibacillus psychroresistens]
MSIISFKNKPIRVLYILSTPQNLNQLKNKLTEMELNLDFRKKLKKISSVELINDVAIFIYNDGTKLYLEVS